MDMQHAMEGEMDYHGFLDGKAPGAVQKIREVLEKEGNPFGSSREGLMSMKKLMESLASSSYTKAKAEETSRGTMVYKINGNRIPKAAYRYYQYLKSIGYSEEQESGKKKASYTDGSFSDKTKEDNAMRGTVKNGVMTIWRKGSKENAPETRTQETAAAKVIQNANTSSMEDKAQEIVSGFEKGKISLTKARQDIKDILAKTNEERWGQKLTNDECIAAQGVLSDALGKINSMQVEKRKARKKAAKETTKAEEKDDSIFGRVEDADKEMLDALGLSADDLNEEVLEAPDGISNTAEELLTADSRAWKETLREAWNSTGSSKMLPVMDTPLVLQLVGAKHLPMFLAGSKLQKIKNDHPELTKAILYKLPEYMADPMIIFKSNTVPGRVVMGLSLKDSAGVNVVVPIELNARGGRIDMNVLTSIYGRGNRRHTDNDYKWFVDNVISGNTLYVNKKTGR